MELAFSSPRSAGASRMLSSFPGSSWSSRRPVVARKAALSQPSFASTNASFSSLSRPSSSSCSLGAAPFGGGSVHADFNGLKMRVPSINLPAQSGGRRPARDVVAMVIPFTRGHAWEQPPPDLASYLFKNRIVYLGMCLVPAVTELLMAEFMYLQYDDDKKPIYLYINSTGTTKGEMKLGHEAEAFAIYDFMSYVTNPIFTLCVGNAWGEAAMLLAAGAKGNRAALPSSTIMIKQPIGRFEGQATDVDIASKEMNKVKAYMVTLYARHIGKSPEQIEQDIRRPKYFSPSEAVEYGIIDKVLYSERSPEDRGVVADLKRSKLI